MSCLLLVEPGTGLLKAVAEGIGLFGYVHDAASRNNTGRYAGFQPYSGLSGHSSIGYPVKRSDQYIAVHGVSSRIGFCYGIGCSSSGSSDIWAGV